ncbi:ATP-binding cassette sub-family A member 3 [Aplysia californica]|uniref:ATP-binding cassette sub-family A member 3 n=1 Tax=Aplysia californica TaxID=6500 RepID=A0ABM1W167_APLCA|nr:ATP-binding cassette sub-family A member 3 [Aplysia californica]
MMIVDIGLHLLITWYMDNIYPGEFGVPKPLYFPFLKSFWCPSHIKEEVSTQSEQVDTKHLETDPQNLNAGIAIKDLTKIFAGGKVAVAGMSLNMYEDQITVLLGHNGAGKTTTMSMLTGFMAPSSGTAVVNGYDIRSNIDEVRETLGLCPQHNILFDQLTVREHLYFFAKMKGVSGNLDALIATVVNDMFLTGKENTQAQHLSGGQKRKLSVGIALIGGSKVNRVFLLVVILDEPSSGMDPGARRHLWDVLQRNKRGRTVLLTTHYMDEADALGDRIAIMAEGVVKCCGTSMFLKKLYGAGYHLIIVKDDECRVDEITQIVRSTLLMPLALTAGGVAILNSGSSEKQEVGDQGTVRYDLSPFYRPIVSYTDGSPASSISSDLAEKYAEIFSTHPGTAEKINQDKSSNVSEYLLWKMHDVGFDIFSQRFPIGAEFLPQSNNSIKGVALYNDRAWHAKPVALVQMLNAFIREYVGDDYSIQASLHPMPKPMLARGSSFRDTGDNLKNIYPLTIFLSLGMAYLLSSFAYTLIVERQRGCKHLQEVSGVNPFIYWLATFLWDYIIYLAVVIGIIVIFFGFGETALIGEDAFGPLIFMFLLFGFAACFSSYVFQFVFKSPPTGFVVTLILYFILSLFTNLMLTAIKSKWRNDFRNLFSVLFLPFNLNKFITDYYNWHSEVPSKLAFAASKKPGQSVWDFDSPGVGLYVFMMALHAGVALLLLMLIEFHVLQKIWYLIRKSGERKDQAPLQEINMTSLFTEDSDVAQERDRIFRTTLPQLFTTDSLILMELSKNFGQMTAVDHLCVGVPEQECFGLLGQNGAGKTTTFKMLTGQEMVSWGNAYVKTHDIKDNIKKVQSNMGYCPQFDALTDQLTGKETLTLYCRIKGIPEEEITRVCNSLIDSLMLTPHADKLVGKYRYLSRVPRFRPVPETHTRAAEEMLLLLLSDYAVETQLEK